MNKSKTNVAKPRRSKQAAAVNTPEFRLRWALGTSQTNIAKALNKILANAKARGRVNAPMVSDWESGRHRPSARVCWAYGQLARLAEINVTSEANYNPWEAVFWPDPCPAGWSYYTDTQARVIRKILNE